MDFTVVGQGVIGLTSALILARAGHRVEVVSDRPALASTLRVACAVWLPLYVGAQDGKPAEYARARRWAQESYAAFQELTGPEWGIRSVELFRFGASSTDRPDMAGIVPGFREQFFEDFPEDLRHVWSFPSFAIDMDGYLRALNDELKSLGVSQTSGIQFATLTDLVKRAAGRVVLNCTGLGSAELCADGAFQPAKGVVLLHEQRPMDVILSADSFVLAPRAGAIAMGAGYDSAYVSEDPTVEEQDRIFDYHTRWRGLDLGRIGVRLPQFSRECVVSALGGLRPVRATGIRLDAEEVLGRTVVHNYGHGGAGVTLSWGSAAEAVRLAIAAIGECR